MAKRADIRVGISGWTYEPWRGVFYPKGLAHRRELEYASRVFNSIEINGSFYSLQKPAIYRKWFDETPDGFLFAVKGPQYITHRKRLKDVRVPLANFFASGVLLLGHKLGPLLWQFPPWEKFDPLRFEAFFDLLPRTTAEASALASENNIKIAANRWTEAVADTRLRYAIEPRNESFFTEEFVRLLRKHDIALTIADTVQDWGFAEDVTSDLIYIRLHGKEELYASDYSDDEIAVWAKKIRTWQRGSQPRSSIKISRERPQKLPRRDVFAYFDNSIKVHAPFDAHTMSELLGIAKAPLTAPAGMKKR